MKECKVKKLNLTKEQWEEHARKKFVWGDEDIVAYKNKADLENQSKKSGNNLVWY